MSRPAVPLIIASLPGRSLDANRNEASAAARAGADLAEIRFDRWPELERLRAAELFPTPLPLVATLRSRSEGGEGPDDPSQRLTWLHEVLRLPFAWVDLEVARDPTNPARTPGSLVRFVLSSHLGRDVSVEEVARLLAASRPGGSMTKVVLPASVHRAIHELAPLLRTSDPLPRVLLTTGASGQLLRAWGQNLGQAAVYGALPESSTEPVGTVERSQVPVDRLRSFFSAASSPPMFAVVGRPVFHSRSPSLHHQWMASYHRTGLYVALEVASDEEFQEMLPALVAGGFRGVNVTHPFKEAAYRVATDPEASANDCGCANTLTFEEGRVYAGNTDLYAVGRRMEELHRAGRWDGRELLVLGTGGAARATLGAARDRGSRARILARSPSRADTLAEAFGAQRASASAAGAMGLIINATTVGRAPGERLEFSLDGWMAPSSYVLDFVYRPNSPVLSDAARAAGAEYEDGSRLLAYAAAASFERWWGEAPSNVEIERALAAAK